MDELNPAEVNDLVNELSVILHGREPPLQGAVLAELTAIYLAGFISANRDRELEAKLREDMLKLHISYVRQLIPLCLERAEGQIAATLAGWQP